MKGDDMAFVTRLYERARKSLFIEGTKVALQDFERACTFGEEKTHTHTHGLYSLTTAGWTITQRYFLFFCPPLFLILLYIRTDTSDCTKPKQNQEVFFLQLGKIL